MQPITVAIVDVNLEKRAQLEQFLQRDEKSIKVLVDIKSNHKRVGERRIKSRKHLALIDDVVARVNRLKPRVLLANTHQLSGVCYELLIALRRNCPDTLVVLLVEKSVEENQALKALANGARGFLDCSSDFLNFSKAIFAVDQGEAWVPRKILGKAMDKILFTSPRNAAGGCFDSAC